MWNVVLTPLYCSPILDKNDENESCMDGSISEVKNLYKAICYKLYLEDLTCEQLDALFRFIPEEDPRLLPKSVLDKAQQYISGRGRKFDLRTHPLMW